jgi:hypothetical protein
MAPYFRRCYNAALRVDPDETGHTRITAKIGAGGEVASAQAESAGLSQATIYCLLAVVRTASFSPPDGGGATIVIPVTFVVGPTPVPVAPAAPRPASGP